MKASNIAAALVVASLAFISLIVAPIWTAGSSGPSSSLPSTPADVPVSQTGPNPNMQLGMPPCPPGDTCQLETKLGGLTAEILATESPDASAEKENPQQRRAPLTEEGLLPRAEPSMDEPAQDPAGQPPDVPLDGWPATNTPQAAGGPDDFGYTWDDSGALVWIDATAGTDTGLSQAPRGASDLRGHRYRVPLQVLRERLQQPDHQHGGRGGVRWLEPGRPNWDQMGAERGYSQQFHRALSCASLGQLRKLHRPRLLPARRQRAQPVSGGRMVPGPRRY